MEREPPTVLTPHSGELARLLEVETAWVDAHRLEAVHRALERFKCVVLLKGSDTIVAAPGARTLISAGTPRLATAGTGDVLTGIIGAFLSKGMEGQLATTTAARNVARLLDVLDGAELWAVVKANGYGHGAVDVGGAALGAGASVLCVATVAEALELREEFASARILVMGPISTSREVASAREAALELAISDSEIPEGVRVHLKVDTGMGRWGLSELPEPPVEVVGLMSHLASADCDPEFTETQIRMFREATEPYRHLTRHLANSAGALRFPDARFDAARCGVAIYGLSPFGDAPGNDGLEPALQWSSLLAQVRQLAPGESTGYGRRFVAERSTWIGIVPVGYADGFRRDLTGTEVRVEGEPRRVVGTISMDALAVELDRELPAGTPVTLLGDGVMAEDHARVAGTINYELVCGINSNPARSRRVVVDS